MNSVPAIWKDGQIIPIEPIDWPDGTVVSIRPVEEVTEDADFWADEPGAAERRAAYVDSLPPLQMTAEEEAEWQAAREAVKAYTISKMLERHEGDS